MSLPCLACGKTISRTRLGCAWPTSVSCPHCNAKHRFRFGDLIGACYLAVLLPLCVVASLASGFFVVEENGLYRQGLASTLVHFGAIALVAAIGVQVQGVLLGRFGTLRLAPSR